MKDEKIYLLTDGCMWEANKRNGTSHAHSIEVVDVETGAVQYIASGSTICLIQGKITDIRTQAAYNAQGETEVVSTDGKANANKRKSPRKL